MKKTAPIIFGKMHFLLISENEFFHLIKCNGMTSFLEFMCRSYIQSGIRDLHIDSIVDAWGSGHISVLRPGQGDQWGHRALSGRAKGRSGLTWARPRSS